MLKNKNIKTSFIPKDIYLEINEKGFYLHNFLVLKDIKNSLEKDFIYLLGKIGIPIIIFFLIISILFSTGIILFKVFFIISLSFLFLFYLLFKGIFLSHIFLKNAYIVFTDTSIFINSKVISIKNTDFIEKEVSQVKRYFQKDLFNKQIIFNSYKELISEFKIGYEFILEKKIGSIVFLLLTFYSIYIIFMFFIYIFGIIFIRIFGFIIMNINKFLLIKIGYKAIIINDIYYNIDNYSKELNIYKKDIKSLLNKAINNQWEDSLLSNINLQITKINSKVLNTTDLVISLRNKIKDSKFNDMINLDILNLWIKKQVIEPIQDIIKLLKTNLIILEKAKQDLQKQIQITNKKFVSPIKIQEMRLDLQINQIKDNINILNDYLYGILLGNIELKESEI